MANYVLLHGAGSDEWYWHLVAPQLRELGHVVITPNMPVTDDSAGLAEYTDLTVEAIGEHAPVIIVAQSMSGFYAPLVAERVKTDLIVLLNAMIPKPGESGNEWWGATGQGQAAAEFDIEQGRDPNAGFDVVEVFMHDVPPATIKAAFEYGASEQSDTPFEAACPLKAWPNVPTRVLAGTEDRFFPLAFQRRVAQDRLGIEVDEFPSGHLAALAQPDELVKQLEAYRTEYGIE